MHLNNKVFIIPIVCLVLFISSIYSQQCNNPDSHTFDVKSGNSSLFSINGTSRTIELTNATLMIDHQNVIANLQSQISNQTFVIQKLNDTISRLNATVNQLSLLIDKFNKTGQVSASTNTVINTTESSQFIPFNVFLRTNGNSGIEYNPNGTFTIPTGSYLMGIQLLCSPRNGLLHGWIQADDDPNGNLGVWRVCSFYLQTQDGYEIGVCSGFYIAQKPTVISGRLWSGVLAYGENPTQLWINRLS